MDFQEVRLLASKFMLMMFILIIGFFCARAADEADDFQPGYIITDEQDTLKGFISIKDHSYNTRICVFKERETSTAMDYFPGQIEGYGAGTRWYRSYVRKTKEGEEKMFLEAILRGKVSLYFWTDVFFIEHDHKVEELIEIHQEVNQSGRVYQISRPLFRGTLQSAMTDCNSIFHDISTSSLTRRSLVSLFEKYYQCTGVTATHTTSNTGGGKVRLGLALGAAYAELHSTANSDPNYTFLSDGPRPKSVSIIPSLWMEIWNPSISRNLRLKLGINYYNNSFTTTEVSGGRSYDFRLNAGVIEIPLQLKFSFTGKGMYASIGAAQSFIATFDDKLVISSYPGGAPITTATYLEPKGASQFVFSVGYERKFGDRLMFIEANTRFTSMAYGTDTITAGGQVLKGPNFDARIFSLSVGYPITRDKEP